MKNILVEKQISKIFGEIHFDKNSQLSGISQKLYSYPWKTGLQKKTTTPPPLFCEQLILNPIALRKDITLYNFGLSECNRVNIRVKVGKYSLEPLKF